MKANLELLLQTNNTDKAACLFALRALYRQAEIVLQPARCARMICANRLGALQSSFEDYSFYPGEFALLPVFRLLFSWRRPPDLLAFCLLQSYQIPSLFSFTN